MSTPSRYTVVQGSFTIFYPDAPRTGPEPDGDTVTFMPRDPAVVRGLKRYGAIGAKLNTRGTVPVRFEAIDALETHFLGVHQSLELAYRARDAMLAALGFKGVRFYEDAPDRVEKVANDPRPGHLLANGIDSNGRVLALVFSGKAPARDGTGFFVDTKMFDRSVNAAQLRAGLAYAELYTSMPSDLIRHARNLAVGARKSKAGLYAVESVNRRREASIPDLDTLQTLVVFPKLFRRLAAYFREGNLGLAGFDAWLRQDPVNRDDALLLPNGELGNMHDTFAITRDRLRMRVDPESLVILPDQPVPRPTTP